MGQTAMTKKASARGRRKSIVAQYKAKAKGAPDKPVARKPTKVIKKEKPMIMTIKDETYSVGDFAHFVDEHNAAPSRPQASTGTLTAVHPTDSIEPSVSLVDTATGKHRTIRARLIAWSKKDAVTKYKEFLKKAKKK